MTSKHVTVTGRVQGVFYRASAVDRAEALGVHGWVRNRDDGSVEMVVEGDDDAVDRMITWARSGPPHALVDDVEVTDAAPTGGRAVTPE